MRKYITFFRARVLRGAVAVIFLLSQLFGQTVFAQAVSPAVVATRPTDIGDFKATPPVHALGSTSSAPQGLTPAEVKAAYKLPKTGGKGTIAIITAFAHPSIETDLAVFSKQFGLATCTVKNGCLTEHNVAGVTTEDAGWSLEAALDVEWAHAIAPSAKILLVDAKSDSGTNLLAAIDYARAQKGVVAVSMSWGGPEFAKELQYDSHFATAGTSASSTNQAIAFFASSGDDGTGVSWPASSPYVVAVGGTTLTLNAKGAFVSEKAWSGSGGGTSQYEPEPAYQAAYVIAKDDGGMRAIPDVAYDADPQTGFSIYHVESKATASASAKGWYVVGGTSAGAPQWAAIRALGGTAGKATDAQFYADKAGADNGKYFRDIVSGENGDCGFYCDARKHYDYVTGLGSPLTDAF